MPAQTTEPVTRNVWRQLVSLSKPFFFSSVRWRARGALALILCLLLLLNALNVANSYVGRNFITAVSKHDWQAYVRFALLYVSVFAASTVTGVTQQYVQDRLAISWRDWLTRHVVHKYLEAGTLERIRAKRYIDNPDQRIQEDVRLFTTTLLSFVVMLTNSTLTAIAFAGVLWSITPILLLAVIAYATFGSVFTVLIGYPLVDLNNSQLKNEADLRFELIRVRETRDQATHRGHPRTGMRVHARLRQVMRNARSIAGVSRNVGFFTSGYNYMVQLLPLLIIAPRYLRGQIELGVVTQSAMAFAQLLGAFSLIVAQFQSLSAFAAVVARIGTLWEEIGANVPQPEPARERGYALLSSGADVSVPSQR